MSSISNAVRPLRWTPAATVSTIFSLVTGLSAAAAVLGLFTLRMQVPRVVPRIAQQSLPDADWIGYRTISHVDASTFLSTGLQQLLSIVAVVALLVLLAACISAAITLASRGTARRYELAVRALIGASRRRLTADLLIESLLVAGSAAAVGLFIGFAAAAWLRQRWPAQLTTSTTLPLAVLLPVAAVMATGVLFGLLPRLRMQHARWKGDALAPEARQQPGLAAADLRNALLTGQIALAIVLSACAYQLHRIQAGDSKELQFASGVQIAPVRTASAHETHQLLYSVSHLTGVSRASIATPGAVIGVGTAERVMSECGRCSIGMMMTPLLPVVAQQHAISPGFFDTLGVALVRGEDFGRNAARELIVNETFARVAFDDGVAVGRRVQVGGQDEWYTVIAVVPDFPTRVLSTLARSGGVTQTQTHTAPAVYFNILGRNAHDAELLFRGTSERFSALTAGSIQGAEPLEGYIARAEAPARWFARVLTVLAAIVCVIVLQSVQALIAFSVQLRRSEIALRRAVGARRRAVVLLVLRDVARPLAAALIAGVAAAPVIIALLRVQIPALPPLSVGPLAGISLLVALAALVAAWLPARGAARTAPAALLHYE